MQGIVVGAAAADGAGVGGFVEAGVKTVVYKGQLVNVVDVPVQLGQPLVVLLFECKSLVGPVS